MSEELESQVTRDTKNFTRDEMAAYWQGRRTQSYEFPTDLLSDQEIRARALECAAALPAPSATWHSSDILKLALEFEAYIRNGR